MGIEPMKGVDHDYIYSIKANNTVYKTYVKETVDMYESILKKFNIKYKTTKVKVLKCKFQNLGENGAEAYFTWEPKSGCFIPHDVPAIDEAMPWE